MADVNKSKATNEMFSQREGGVWPAQQLLLHIGLHLSLYRKKPQKAFIMSLNASHMSCVYIRGKRVDIVQLAPKKCRCPSYHTRRRCGGRGTHAFSNRISNTFERCALHASLEVHTCVTCRRGVGNLLLLRLDEQYCFIRYYWRRTMELFVNQLFPLVIVVLVLTFKNTYMMFEDDVVLPIHLPFTLLPFSYIGSHKVVTNESSKHKWAELHVGRKHLWHLVPTFFVKSLIQIQGAKFSTLSFMLFFVALVQ